MERFLDYRLLLIFLSTIILAAADDIFPFSSALLAANESSMEDASTPPNFQPSATLLDSSLELRSMPLQPRKAQAASNACASSYTQCPGMPSLCCPSNSQCLPDAQGMVGCCPHGALCTGIVPQNSPTATASSSATVAGAAGGEVVTTTAAPTQSGGQVSILGGSLTASGEDGSQTIFANAGNRHVGQRQDGARAGSGLAFGVAVGGLLML